MTAPWWSAILSPAAALVNGRSGSETYMALPRRSAPALLVDVTLPSALETSLTRTGSNRSRRSVLAGRVAAAGLRSEVLRTRLPLTLSAPAPSTTLRAALAEQLEVDVRLAVTAGPVRPNRKPVARLFDPDEQLVGFAKVAWDPATDALIGNERTVLRRLGTAPIAGIGVPTVRAELPWIGHTTLVTDPLPLPPSHGSDPEPVAELEMLLAINTADGVTTARLEDLAYWTELRGRLRGADASGADTNGTDALVAATERAARGLDLQVGLLHGDWSPWNFARDAQSGNLLVWDWERSKPGVPIGVDLAHHSFQMERFLRSTPIETATPAVLRLVGEQLGALGVDPQHASVLVRIELLETLARLTESGLRAMMADRVQAIRSVLSALDES